MRRVVAETMLVDFTCFLLCFCFVSGVKVNLPKAKGTTPMVKLTPSTGWGAKRQNGSATTPLHGPEIIATTPSQALVLVAPLVLVVTRSTSSNSTSSSKAYTSTYPGSTNCSHILVPGQTSSLHGIGSETTKWLGNDSVARPRNRSSDTVASTSTGSTIITSS